MFAGICTFVIMLLVCVNAFARKAFNVPVPATVEIVQAMLVAIIMLPFAYTQIRREHVSTIFFTQKLPHNVRRWLRVFWLIVGAIVFIMVAYSTLQYGLRSYNMNELTWGSTIQFPVWPSKVVVSVGALLLVIQFLLDALHAILIDDERDVELDPMESQVHV